MFFNDSIAISPARIDLLDAVPEPDPSEITVTGLNATIIPLFDLYRVNRKMVYETGTVGPVEFGTKPANGAYDALWTRDHAYTLWHLPRLFPTLQRQDWIEHRITSRSTGVEADPDGGTLPADFIVDRIELNGTKHWKNAGASNLPFMDGIWFVVLTLYADWQITGDSTLFTTYESAINDCLNAIPVDGNGAVWSDPADPSVDFGFTDTVLKTGAVTMGTALHVWSYKMLAEINGEVDSGTYTTKMNTALAGLATLRGVNDYYMGSETNNSGVDDVWATALIVAEGLVTGQDRIDSAQALADDYNAGNLTQNGWVRHLPVGQYWVNTTTTADTYQNGGYWAIPLYDLVRAISLVDTVAAQELADAAAVELAQQVTDEGTVGANTAPYEWFFGATNSTPKGYTASLAAFSRFADASPTRTLTHDITPNLEDDFSSDTIANYTVSSITYDGTNDVMTGSGTPDGKYFVHNTPLTAAQGVSMDVTATDWANIFPAIILRFQTGASYIFCHLVAQPAGVFKLEIYERASSVNTLKATITLTGDKPAAGAYVNMRAWAVGTTVVCEALGQRVTGTVVLNALGHAGGRHGATGTGVSRFDNFKAWELTAGALPADVALVSDSQLIAAGEQQAMVVTNAYLIDAEGDLIDSGSASVGATAAT